MGKLYNRRPLSVSTNTGVDYKYFNHCNWNGLCTNKNYFNIDQETFEDCQNVYIDINAILKSRPAAKLQTVTNFAKSNNIDDVWTFDKKYYAVAGDIVTDDVTISDIGNSVKLVEHNNSVLALGDYWTYVNSTSTDPADILYIPVVKYSLDNVVSDDKEDKNVLTNAYREVYQYTDRTNILDKDFENQTVQVSVGDHDYGTTMYPAGLHTTLTKPLLDVSDYVPLNSGISNTTYTNISKSKLGTYILSAQLLMDKYDAYYYDGTILKYIGTLKNCLSAPVISEDGSVVAYVGYDDIVVDGEDLPSRPILYFKSLFRISDNDPYYEDWTIVQSFNNIDAFDGGVLNVTPDVKVKSSSEYFVVIPYSHAYKYDHYYERVFLYYYDGDIRTFDTQVGSIRFSDRINTQMVKTDDGLVFHCLYIDYGKNALTMYTGILTDIDVTKSSTKVLCPRTSDRQALIYNIFVTDYLTGKAMVLYTTVTELRKIVIDYDTHDIITDTRLFSYDFSYRTYATLLSENSALVRIDNIGRYYYDLRSLKYYIIPFVDNSWPIGVNYSNDITLVNGDGILYTNVFTDLITITKTVAGNVSTFKPDHVAVLDELFVSKDNILYISKASSDGKLYLPESRVQTFNKRITNLYPISDSSMGIFFDDAVWYSNVDDNGLYYYNKSKLNVGCKEGGDVISSYDGTNVIFSTERGLAYMSYQDFVQSTDQILTFMSNNILDRYLDFAKTPVKLHLSKYWLYCYHRDSNELYVLDTRNNSWWYWKLNEKLRKIVKYDNDVLLLAEKSTGRNTILFDYGDDDYSDDGKNIDWHIVSQKLHLGTLNYYKNVLSILLNNVQTDVEKVSAFTLNLTNYRIDVSDRFDEPKSIDYEVNLLRTYIKRCNCKKINEIQYKITNDESETRSPLSLNSISIKYVISGQVR